MASKQTEHYGLNQWEAGDNFLRAEFNEDNRKVDAAIAATPKVVVGSYVGKPGNLEPVHVGFYPVAVHIEPNTGGRGGDYSHGGLALRGLPLLHRGNVALEITEDGFAVRNISLYGNGITYHYLAIG